MPPQQSSLPRRALNGVMMSYFKWLKNWHFCGVVNRFRVLGVFIVILRWFWAKKNQQQPLPVFWGKSNKSVRMDWAIFHSCSSTQ